MELGKCGCCSANWHTVSDGKLVTPVRVPISEEGDTIMAVCRDCAEILSAEDVAGIARTRYVDSGKSSLFVQAQVSEAFASIENWVVRMNARTTALA